VLRKNYYVTLGIPPNESPEGIRHAFRDVVKRYHPDRVGSERLEFFRKIVEAYRVLADPERRRDYDRGLDHATFGLGAEASPLVLGAADPGALPQPLPTLRTFHIKDAAFEAALARVSGTLTATAAQFVEKDYCEGLNTVVSLSAGEARGGGIIQLAVPSCCPCDRCGGSGREGLFSCAVCDGEGLLEEEEWLRVHVPPEVADGTAMKIPLRGLGVHNFYLRLHIRVGW
jgi:DnaJ-class molecular chaperone